MQSLYNGLEKVAHYKVESCDSLEDIAAVTHYTKDELVNLIQDIVDMDQRDHSKEDEYSEI